MVYLLLVLFCCGIAKYFACGNLIKLHHRLASEYFLNINGWMASNGSLMLFSISNKTLLWLEQQRK